MSETPYHAPAPRGKNDSAILDDVFQAKEQQPTPETTKAANAERLQALLPGISAVELKMLTASLNKTGTLDSFLVLASDPKT